MKRKCKHVWDCGNVVWINDIPKIKAECNMCKKEIIEEFGHFNFNCSTQEEIQEMLIKENKRRRKVEK